MNKIRIFSTFLAVLFLIGACQKTEFSPNPTLRVSALPVITSPTSGSSIVLTEATANDPFTVTWTGAEFGFRAAATYSVEVDRAGNDFKDAVVLGTSTGLTLASTVAKFNTALFSTLALPSAEASTIEMRLSVKISPEVNVIYSDAITLQVTPYKIVIVYPQLQVPGSYQGWNPGDNSTVIFSAKSDNKYEGYVYFKDDNTEFKYTVGPSWDTNYGDIGANGSLEKNGDNIKAPTKGVYRLNVNLNELTHTNVRTDWGLIGSATPDAWNSDQNMTYDPANNKWTITLNLVAGDIKFRANDDWPINLGDTQANKSLEYGGDNIAIAAAGNYTIDLILSGAVYTYTIKKN
ncbi:MAG: SusE domain-containing protein [Saprospiraceae bacterium]